VCPSGPLPRYGRLNRRFARVARDVEPLFLLEDFVIARAAASVIAASAIVLGATGCSFFAPIATQIEYQPSDGTVGVVGDVKALNVIAVTDDGEDASLIMSLVNSGDARQRVNFQYTDAAGEKQDLSVYADPGASTAVGYEDASESIVLAGIDAEVGSLFPVYMQYGDEEGASMLVPVLDDAQPHFSELLPTITPTAVPE
jgi:hypothetical protein